ncbi:MAG TPA: DUF983 domain-containing protein [Gemmatimonadaceae bacterium]|nr:DUF983 domain-containing protein [Gemmatimonadaceae bacterium]
MRELFLYIDNIPWVVERRHEMTQLMTRTAHRERRLFLFFQGPHGELRRAEIPEDFPEDPPPAALENVWRFAEVLQPANQGEMQTETELVVPRLGNSVQLLWRAMRLRCPHCGGRPVLRTWFHLHDHCGACGLRLERGEAEDYYLGGVMFNLFLSELVFAVLFVVLVIALWPNVPWTALEYGIATAVLIAPFLFYPMSKLLWLAFDIAFRPVTPAEMAWHHRDTTANPDHRSPLT